MSLRLLAAVLVLALAVGGSGVRTLKADAPAPASAVAPEPAPATPAVGPVASPAPASEAPGAANATNKNLMAPGTPQPLGIPGLTHAAAPFGFKPKPLTSTNGRRMRSLLDESYRESHMREPDNDRIQLTDTYATGVQGRVGWGANDKPPHDETHAWLLRGGE